MSDLRGSIEDSSRRPMKHRLTNTPYCRSRGIGSYRLIDLDSRASVGVSGDGVQEGDGEVRGKK